MSDEIELTVSPSQLRAIQMNAQFMREHCDMLLNAISQIKPLPETESPVVTDNVTPITEVV